LAKNVCKCQRRNSELNGDAHEQLSVPPLPPTVAVAAFADLSTPDSATAQCPTPVVTADPNRQHQEA